MKCEEKPALLAALHHVGVYIVGHTSPTILAAAASTVSGMVLGHCLRIAGIRSAVYECFGGKEPVVQCLDFLSHSVLFDSPIVVDIAVTLPQDERQGSNSCGTATDSDSESEPLRGGRGRAEPEVFTQLVTIQDGLDVDSSTPTINRGVHGVGSRQRLSTY